MKHEMEFKETDFVHEFAEVSSSTIIFPKYRERYIVQTQKYIIRALNERKISCVVNMDERVIEVSTNKKTRDPFVFIKAISFIRLVCRGVGVEEAMKILEEEYFCETIDIKQMVKSEKVFEKRRNRLVGKGGMTLKAIEMLTKCHIFVQGKTVCVIGSFRNIGEVKKIVVDCMNNIHPVYSIKELIEKRKLESDPSKSLEDWTRFIPKVRKSNKKFKKILPRKTGGAPDNIPKRMEDVKLMTGEYFMDIDYGKGNKMEGYAEKRKKRENQKET